MFKNLFLFNGRIRRTEYGISFIIYIVFYVMMRLMPAGSGGAKALLLGLIPMLWFLWSQGAKRCHDLGKSGWYQIIPLYFLWLIFQEGSPEWNEYGYSPKVPVTFDPDKFEDPLSPPAP